MPAMHLMSVDLPAPLSPTSAITSPARTSKSTSVSACTEPKFFDTPRSSRSGSVDGCGEFWGRKGAVGAGGRQPGGRPSSRWFLAYADQQYFLYSPTQTSLF